MISTLNSEDVVDMDIEPIVYHNQKPPAIKKEDSLPYMLKLKYVSVDQIPDLVRKDKDASTTKVLLVAEKDKVKKNCEDKCTMCSKKFEQLTFVFDRIIPITAFGSSILDNYQILCADCNSNIKKKIINKIFKHISKYQPDLMIHFSRQFGIAFCQNYHDFYQWVQKHKEIPDLRFVNNADFWQEFQYYFGPELLGFVNYHKIEVKNTI